MAKIMDPMLPILSILGYWAILLGSFGGPGTHSRSSKREVPSIGGPILESLCEGSCCFASLLFGNSYILPW